ASFYMKKVPVLFFFTGTHLDYHKPSDTAEKINYEGLAKIIDYVATMVRSVDEKVVKPTYTVAKSSSATGGRANFSITLGTIPGYSDSNDGMVIDGVRDDSPASRTGLKANDKIVKLAGMEIKSVQDYMKAMGVMKAGEEYEIEFIRGTERMTLKIIPVKRP
ncbi:MAG: PDZ domain-containing protein, partial [Pyrinomonadaceae bacterium]